MITKQLLLLLPEKILCDCKKDYLNIKVTYRKFGKLRIDKVCGECFLTLRDNQFVDILDYEGVR
jgi:hypothetical protein